MEEDRLSDLEEESDETLGEGSSTARHNRSIISAASDSGAVGDTRETSGNRHGVSAQTTEMEIDSTVIINYVENCNNAPGNDIARIEHGSDNEVDEGIDKEIMNPPGDGMVNGGIDEVVASELDEGIDNKIDDGANAKIGIGVDRGICGRAGNKNSDKSESRVDGSIGASCGSTQQLEQPGEVASRDQRLPQITKQRNDTQAQRRREMGISMPPSERRRARGLETLCGSGAAAQILVEGGEETVAGKIAEEEDRAMNSYHSRDGNETELSPSSAEEVEQVSLPLSKASIPDYKEQEGGVSVQEAAPEHGSFPSPQPRAPPVAAFCLSPGVDASKDFCLENAVMEPLDSPQGTALLAKKASRSLLSPRHVKEERC